MSGLTAAVSTALGMTMLTATPASSVTQIAHKCEGSTIVRCANVEMPSTGVFNAHARVSSSSVAYKVMVTYVELQYYSSGSWRTLREEFPYPVYEIGQDVARTDTYACGSSARKLVRARVKVAWDNGSTVTRDELVTESAYICPR
ncbi:hypothetical protein H9Y04_34160 [Streptomyces sp. TRM66268-LWL]|uniref:Secreted protein n=1 Tax=Streptomyces polyasparticus TaxID=2767826 RepID=A0ABR7SQB6_9ACTN|nr:hypothetical protein [Streptomyces polyasparticus]MBC9717588.1 hypothetical protein [Streptomyces polyasparticus]